MFESHPAETRLMTLMHHKSLWNFNIDISTRYYTWHGSWTNFVTWNGSTAIAPPWTEMYPLTAKGQAPNNYVTIYLSIFVPLY